MPNQTNQEQSCQTKLNTTNSNQRVVHVSVPEVVFNHGKAQAYLSGIPWAKFIEHLIENSQPINKQ